MTQGMRAGSSGDRAAQFRVRARLVKNYPKEHMPAKSIFASLFSKSPIQPIHDHMDVCVETAVLLPVFFSRVLAQDWSAAEATYNDIADAEERADDLKKQIRLGLPRSLFLPFSRDDLLDLLTAQDHVANTVKDVAGLVLGRQMKFPTSLHGELTSFVDASVTAVQFLSDGTDELSTLIQAGFSGQKIAALKVIIENLGEAESTTDVIERSLRQQLFALEDELPSVDVIFMYETIEIIGAVADSAQHAGNRLIQLLGS